MTRFIDNRQIYVPCLLDAEGDKKPQALSSIVHLSRIPSVTYTRQERPSSLGCGIYDSKSKIIVL